MNSYSDSRRIVELRRERDAALEALSQAEASIDQLRRQMRAMRRYSEELEKQIPDRNVIDEIKGFLSQEET